MNKKDQFKRFIKKDGFYVVLFVCLCLVSTVGVMVANKGTNNTVEENIAENTIENTEDAVAVFSEDVPYLKSVESPGEEISPKYESEISMYISDFKSKIKKSIPNSNLGNNINEEVKILNRNTGGTVNDIKIGDATIKGKEFRKIFGLNSANFTLEILNDNIKIKCLGYGHGVGMSQWGANVMAKEGSKYDEILEYYFKGGKIEESNKILIE